MSLIRSFSYEQCSFNEVLDDLWARFVVNTPAEEIQSVERVGFLIEEAHWFYLDFAREQNPKLRKLDFKTFCSLTLQKCPGLSHLGNKTKDAYLHFMAYKASVPVRGAIILTPDMRQTLLVKGWDKSSGWAFPKGKINKDEPDHECAIREVKEEIGFDISPYLKKEDYIDLNLRGRSTRLYIVVGVDANTSFQPQTRKEISAVGWFRLADLAQLVPKGKDSALSRFTPPLLKFVASKTENKSSKKKSKSDRSNADKDKSTALLSMLKSSTNDNDTHNPDEKALLNLIHGSGANASKESPATIDPPSPVDVNRLVEMLKLSDGASQNSNGAPVEPVRANYNSSAPIYSAPDASSLLSHLLASPEAPPPMPSAALRQSSAITKNSRKLLNTLLAKTPDNHMTELRPEFPFPQDASYSNGMAMPVAHQYQYGSGTHRTGTPAMYQYAESESATPGAYQYMTFGNGSGTPGVYSVHSMRGSTCSPVPQPGYMERPTPVMPQSEYGYNAASIQRWSESTEPVSLNGGMYNHENEQLSDDAGSNNDKGEKKGEKNLLSFLKTFTES
ncbi:hypothetical protein CANCADRAFT_30068 [Tortispora caseinolytica NRRL Y-17796]|uniref:Nudix hydrolase domain-containing protein n=1 Tax=Tortispora caseinolytica NRRL Y-17796 TaxID=767744 RepID=A0A1E4TJ00_9ASCO|nr:hypothetical protein CANCADRAFT_30068 [Tortispora caseinolytica NRRL Y-17796]